MAKNLLDPQTVWLNYFGVVVGYFWKIVVELNKKILQPQIFLPNNV